MKRTYTLLTIIFLTLSVSFGMVGCSSEGEQGSSTDSSFHHSESLDQDGFWKDVNALDYVDLAPYIGIQIPAHIHTVPDETVQMEIDEMLFEFSFTNEITDRAVKDGDTVHIDFVGKIDDEPFEGGDTQGMGTDVTIGVTQYIEGFLEQLIGNSPGETFDIEVTFPDDYGHPDLNGKEAVFTITIHYIKETVEPELTDAFVLEHLSEYFDVHTVEGLYAVIRKEIKDAQTLEYIQQYLFNNTKIDVLPETIMGYLERSLIDYFDDYANQYGMSLNEFLEDYMELSSVDELLTEYRQYNTDTATFYVILQAIAEEADIRVDDADVAAYFRTYLDTDDYSQYEEMFGMPYLKLTVLHQKVLDYIDEHKTLG